MRDPAGHRDFGGRHMTPAPAVAVSRLADSPAVGRQGKSKYHSKRKGMAERSFGE
jgi:hypothetical protein